MTKQDTTLFYYGGSETLTHLKRGYLPFHQGWDFLEPFVRFASWHAEKTQPVTEAEILHGLELEYRNLPENIQGLLAFEDFLQQRSKFEDAIRSRISRQRSATLQGYSVERFTRASCLRLFSSAVNPIAWQQFADNHRGLCVALTTRARALQPATGYPLLLKPVSYGSEHRVNADQANPIPGAFCDHEQNHVLAEWRAILPKPDDAPIRLKLRQGDVVQIFVSVQAEPDLLTDLQRLVEQDINYRRCEVLQVVPDVSMWRLTASPIDPNHS